MARRSLQFTPISPDITDFSVFGSNKGFSSKDVVFFLYGSYFTREHFV